MIQARAAVDSNVALPSATYAFSHSQDPFLPFMASRYKALVPPTERIVDLTKQLRYHAGLEPDLRLGVPSLSDALWKKTSITASVDDVLRLLHLLNHEVNGLVPSASTEDHGQFSRQLIYAVTEIIDLLRGEHQLPDTEIGLAGRRIAFAWSCVLAGDIDDIRQEIADDEAMRS
jgi:hypothetical protein